jgi:asparagine synthetase B (glutamine-hydrolysing)
VAGHPAVGLKIQGQEGKYLFKKALEPHLPNDVLYRPKMGFAVPLARWFRGPLKQRVRDAVLGESLASTGWFNAVVPEPSGGRPPVGGAGLQCAVVDADDV